jgi:hypothetical protein
MYSCWLLNQIVHTATTGLLRVKYLWTSYTSLNWCKYDYSVQSCLCTNERYSFCFYRTWCVCTILQFWKSLITSPWNDLLCCYNTAFVGSKNLLKQYKYLTHVCSSICTCASVMKCLIIAVLKMCFFVNMNLLFKITQTKLRKLVVDSKLRKTEK